MTKDTEKLNQQAEIIRQITDLSMQLDVAYLEDALEKLEDMVSTREAAVILAPNPRLAISKNDLDKSKNIQLRNFLAVAKQARDVMDKQFEQMDTVRNQNKLNKIFGL